MRILPSQATWSPYPLGREAHKLVRFVYENPGTLTGWTGSLDDANIIMLEGDIIHRDEDAIPESIEETSAWDELLKFIAEESTPVPAPLPPWETVGDIRCRCIAEPNTGWDGDSVPLEMPGDETRPMRAIGYAPTEKVRIGPLLRHLEPCDVLPCDGIPMEIIGNEDITKPAAPRNSTPVHLDGAEFPSGVRW